MSSDSTADLSAQWERLTAGEAEAPLPVQDIYGQLRLFAESDIIGIVLCDIYGNIRFANDEYLRITGYAREELESGLLRWTDITPEEWVRCDERGIAEARARGSCTPYEKQYVRKDGSRIWILVGYILLGPRREDAVAYVLDLSARKKAEAALRESNERLRAALSASGTGTFRWSMRTNSLVWDESLDRLFGLPPGSTVRCLESFLLLVHPDDRQDVLDACRNSANRGADFDREYRVIWPDGSVHWLASKGKTFCDPFGRPLYMTGASVDITAHKQAEEALRAAEERFRTIAEAVPQLVWVTRPDGYVEYFNQRWYDFTGLSAADCLGFHWSRCLHPDDQQRAIERWQLSVDTGEPYEIEYRICSVDGTHRWFLGRALPVRDAEQRITHWFGTCTDIDEKKRTEELLKASDQKKDDFLALLAQELSNPLAEIVSAVDALDAIDPTDAAAGELREAIGRQARQAAGLLDALLRQSRAEHDKVA